MQERLYVDLYNGWPAVAMYMCSREISDKQYTLNHLVDDSNGERNMCWQGNHSTHLEIVTHLTKSVLQLFQFDKLNFLFLLL